jgi:hypothetical protein
MEYLSPAPTTRQVSVSEASRELSISPETVRRWIKSGRLQAERAIRPQGAMWLVTLPVTSPRGVLPVTTPHDTVAQESDHESDHATTTATSNEALYPSPPVAELAALTTTVQQQSETIARLTRMLEQVMAEVEVLKAQPSTLDAPTAMQAPEPSNREPLRFWRRSWAVYGVVVLLVIGALVVLLQAWLT